jgi:hypothetical protein
MAMRKPVLTGQRLGFFACGLVLVLAVSPAWANAGTAMAIAVGLLLIVGNFVIGIVEWIGLSLLGASKLRAAIMIPANYISAWIGVYIVSTIPTDRLLQGDFLLTNALPLSWALLLGLTLIGLLIELPFVAIAFRSPRSWRRILAATLLVNAVTGVGVVLWYVKNSNMSLASDFRVAQSSEVAGDLTGWVYRIDHESATVRRTRMNGSGDEWVVNLPAIPEKYLQSGGRVWLMLHPGDDDLLDLCIGLHAGWIGPGSIDELSPENGWQTAIDGHVSKIVAPGVGASGSLWFQFPDESTLPRYARVAADLRGNEHKGALVEQSLSPWSPIQVTLADGTTQRLGLVNAMLGTSATAQTATVLPGDRLVFAIADAEGPASRGIFIASLREKTVAYLAKGRSPVVVLDPAD